MTPRRRLVRLARSALAASLLGAGACLGGQSTDDFGSRTGDEPSQVCRPERVVLAEPDAAARQALEWIDGRYAIAGRWGVPSAVVSHQPSDVPLHGELEVRYEGGRLARLEGCEGGTELEVTIVLRTADGALREELAASALVPLPEQRLVRLRAELDLTALAGSFTFAGTEGWTLKAASLTAELTPLASRGQLRASPQRARDGEGEHAGMSWTSPAADPLLQWPTGPSPCGDLGEPWQPTDSASARQLETRRMQANAGAYPVVFPDGSATLLHVELAEPQAVCGDAIMTLPASARLWTDDGTLEVALPVMLATSDVFGPLHWNARTDLPWAFPPADFAARVGRAPGELSGFAHVGVEAWFSLLPEGSARGWLKLLGYHTGDCLLCEAAGCRECPTDARATQLLELTIGDR